MNKADRLTHRQETTAALEAARDAYDAAYARAARVNSAQADSALDVAGANLAAAIAAHAAAVKGKDRRLRPRMVSNRSADDYTRS